MAAVLAAVAIATSHPALAATTHVVDDAPSIGPGPSFMYQGRWEHVGGVDDGRLAGTSSRSTKAFSAAALDFTGTAIRLYGILGPRGGRAIVAIDGHIVDRDVSFYAPSKEVHHLVFSRTNLPLGRHRIAIVVVGDASGSTHNTYVNLDGAEYES